MAALFCHSGCVPLSGLSEGAILGVMNGAVPRCLTEQE